MPNLVLLRGVYYIISDNKIVFETRYLENAQAFIDGWKIGMQIDEEEGA